MYELCSSKACWEWHNSLRLSLMPVNNMGASHSSKKPGNIGRKLNCTVTFPEFPTKKKRTTFRGSPAGWKNQLEMFVPFSKTRWKTGHFVWIQNGTVSLSVFPITKPRKTVWTVPFVPSLARFHKPIFFFWTIKWKTACIYYWVF